LSLDEFDPSKPTWQGHPLTNWTLALHLNGSNIPAASATMTWHPEGCPHGSGWCIGGFLIRARYRGAGFDIDLTHKIDEILGRSGMKIQASITWDLE
jgi:hypothetical protein